MASDLPDIDLEPGSDTSKRAALYLRISKADGRQTEENQRRELRKFLQKEGYELAGEYVDHESGRKKRREREASIVEDGKAGGADRRGWHAEAKDAWQEAVGLTWGMAWHIVGAVAVAALVMGYLPENLLLNVAGPDRWYAIPAAALVGVPFYVSVEALAPVGAALASKGMSVGAVFALTVAGAGVNVPEFALLDKLLTRGGLAGLVGAVFTVAVAGGFVMQML